MRFNGKSVERIGLFTKTNGNKGAIEFSPDNNVRFVNEKEWVFVDIQQEIIPFFVESISPKGKKLIVCLKYITNLNQAEHLTQKKVFVINETLKSKDSFPLQENFIGFVVIDTETTKEIGKLTAIFEEQANPLMEITGEKDILVPLNDNYITKIDIDNCQIFLKFPDGFLDIY